MGNAAEWYWRRATAEGGPITWDRLQSLAAAGKLGPRDFVRRIDWTNWKLACQVSEHEDAQAADASDRGHEDHGAPAPGAATMPPPLPSLPSLPGMPPLPEMPGLGPPPLSTFSAADHAAPVVSSHARAAHEDRPEHADDEEEAAPDPPPLPRYQGAFPFRREESRPAEPVHQHGMAAAAFVASLAGLVLFALPLGAVALAMAGWSLLTLDMDDARGRRVALAGLALGALDVGAWVAHTVVQLNAIGA